LLKKMRILMIAPQPFYAERGTPMNVMLLCKVLGDAGYHIDLLVFPTGKDVRLKNMRIVRMPNLLNVNFIPVGPSKIKLAYDFLLTAASLCIVSTKRYEVIHGIEEGAFLAVILSKIFRNVSIFDMDSYMSDSLKDSGFIKNQVILNLVEKLEKWCFKKSSVIITVCQALTDRVKLVCPEANISQIEDIPIQNCKNFTDGQVRDLMKKYDLFDFLRVVYTGNLESYQGIDLLLESWKIFCKRKNAIKRCKLIIVGGSTNQINFYKKIASQKGIAESTCWVGQRPSTEMRTWMNLGNVLVSPRSEGENTPLKIYSYMASGRPIVATNRKTHTQVLDNTMAFLAEPEPIHLSQALHDALSGPQLAIQKADNAKQIVEYKYSFSIFRKKLLATYDSFQ